MDAKLNAFRGYFGGVALELGIIGCLLVIVAIPIIVLMGDFWAKFPLNGPSIAEEERQQRSSRLVRRGFFGGDFPLLLLSLFRVCYGLYDGYRKQKSTG